MRALKNPIPQCISFPKLFIPRHFDLFNACPDQPTASDIAGKYMTSNTFSKHCLEAVLALWLLLVRKKQRQSFVLVLQAVIRLIKTLNHNSLRIRSILFLLALAIFTTSHAICFMATTDLRAGGWQVGNLATVLLSCNVVTLSSLMFSLVVVSFGLDPAFLQKLILIKFCQLYSCFCGRTEPWKSLFCHFQKHPNSYIFKNKF